jgi:hypothetical protein
MSKVFQTKKFNPIMDHNARFAKKNLQLNINTMEALEKWIENGGAITVCKPGRRSKANTSFPLIRGTVANAGAKASNLKVAGLKGRKG